MSELVREWLPYEMVQSSQNPLSLPQKKNPQRRGGVCVVWLDYGSMEDIYFGF